MIASQQIKKKSLPLPIVLTLGSALTKTQRFTAIKSHSESTICTRMVSYCVNHTSSGKSSSKTRVIIIINTVGLASALMFCSYTELVSKFESLKFETYLTVSTFHFASRLNPPPHTLNKSRRKIPPGQVTRHYTYTYVRVLRAVTFENACLLYRIIIYYDNKHTELFRLISILTLLLRTVARPI